jgi:hypothetical protein
VHDQEDYVNVRPGTHIDALQLRAEGNPVAIDGIRVHFADGTDQRIEIRRRLRPGEALTIDIPASRSSVKTLVLDYANRGPFWRARETAHVQVLALIDDDNRGKDRDRMRGDRFRRDDHDRAYDRSRDERRPLRSAPPPITERDRVDWSGEIRVRTR